jgi:hypothetical protein
MTPSHQNDAQAPGNWSPSNQSMYNHLQAYAPADA